MLMRVADNRAPDLQTLNSSEHFAVSFFSSENLLRIFLEFTDKYVYNERYIYKNKRELKRSFICEFLMHNRYKLLRKLFAFRSRISSASKCIFCRNIQLNAWINCIKDMYSLYVYISM